MPELVKCRGCNNPAKTKKGWCSGKCYTKNQGILPNKGRFRLGNELTEEHRETLRKLGESKKTNQEWIEAFVERTSRSEINAKKGHKKENHPNWIADRTQLKQKRMSVEEKDFFKQVLSEKGYRCEITGEIGGKLSVHHLDSVHLFLEKKFDKNNVVVVKKEIHFDFHKKYGFQWATKEKWFDYLSKNYNYAVR